MSVAMAVSATLHLVAIVLIGRMLTTESFPSLASVPLLVHIDSRTASSERAAATAARPIPRRESEPPAKTDHERVTPDRAARETAPDNNVARPAPDLGRVTERPAALRVVESRSAQRPPDDESPDGGDRPGNVVAVRQEHPAETPIPVRAEYSARQQKMLSRKVREWTEELHAISDLTSEISWTHDGQEYVATFVEQPPENDMDIARVLVQISTFVDGNHLLSGLEMRRLAFSNFAQFVNRWDPDVQVHDDRMDGRFHANSTIRLAYDRRNRPVFHDKVTTSARRIDVTRLRGTYRKSEVFPGGLETGVRAIRLPHRYVPFPGKLTPDSVDVQRLGADTRIEFLADGRYTLRDTDSDSVSRTGQLSRGVTYFLADRGESVHVRGVVNGRVLVYSPERIVVEGDLVYERDPRVQPESDDFLGLVSDGYVDIAAPDVTGPGDLVIHAAIYARRRFAVRNVRAGESSELRLYGSLSAGTVSATEPRYSTRIQFDQRLADVRPPGFPLTDRYEVESWDRRWTMEATH